jgi:hypothetical protein
MIASPPNTKRTSTLGYHKLPASQDSQQVTKRDESEKNDSKGGKRLHHI